MVTGDNMNSASDTQTHYQKLKQEGKQHLRMLVFLWLLFYMVYAILQVVLLKELFPLRYQQPQIFYLMKLIVEGILWLIILLVLRKGRRIGRLLFGLMTFCSLYFLRYLPAFFQLPLHDGNEQLIRLLFTMLFLSKYLLSISLWYALYHDARIVCIFKKTDSLMQVEQAEEGEEHSSENTQQLLYDVALLQMEDDSKLAKRAQRFLHRYTFYLILYMVITFLGYLALFYVLQISFLTDLNGLQYVQRFFLLATLFTALLWAFVAVAMFLYSEVVLVLIPMAWILELIHMINDIPIVFDTFLTQHYQIPSIICIILLEILRYGILMKLTSNIYQNPFLKMFWKSKRKKRKVREQD